MTATNATATTISLIGMPGAGKSTIGVVLAKLGGLAFVDTDLDIQLKANATLQQILEREGYRRLRAIEQEVLLAISLKRSVVATGGSVVYSEEAMARLKKSGPVVYLELDLPTLQRRVSTAPPRGIASDAGQDYAEIFAERTPLYRHYADFTINAGSGSPEALASSILALLDGTS